MRPHLLSHFLSHRLLPAAATLTLLLTGAGLATPCRADVDRREAEAVARTMLSAINSRVIATGTVQPNLLEEITTTCQKDRLYCKSVALGDEASTQMQLRIDMTLPYATTADIPEPKGWAGVPATLQRTIDAVVRTRTVDTREGKRHVVDVRAARQGVYFHLGTSQLAAARTVEEAVKLAVARAEMMLAAAQANALVGGEELPRVVAKSGEEPDKVLADGDVVYVTVADRGLLRARFEVTARPATLPAGEASDLFVDLPTLEADQRADVGLSPKAERTDLGFHVRSTVTGPVSVILTLERTVFDRLRKGKLTTRLGAVIPVVFRGGGGTRKVFLQFTDWAVVITRFELRSTADPRLSILREQMSKELGEDSVGVGPFRQFNEYRTVLGNLRDAWEDLLPRVTPGTPRNPEEIVAAWARNQATGVDFVRAVHRAGDSNAGARIAGDRLRPEFEVLILRDPRFVPRAASEADTGLAPFTEGEEYDEERSLSALGMDTDQDQVRTWERFFVDTLDVTVHALEDLRGTSSEKPIAVGTLYHMERWDGKWRDDLSRRAISRYVSLNWNVPDETIPPHSSPTPGLYEFRLALGIARREARDDVRTVAVALRVNLVRPGMAVRTLELRTQRGD